MQAPAPIPVYRPSYLTDGLEFQGSLVESPANVFYQRVTASRASLSAAGSGRFQFQWRSVSDNLLMSPVVMLRFQLQIRSEVVWNQIMQYIAVRGVRGPKGARTETETYDGTSAHNQSGSIGPPAICFADGDAFTSCCSSINLQFNGTSLSLNRTDRFWRDWMRTQISSEDAARIYKSSGGAYDQSDAVGVCVPTMQLDAGVNAGLAGVAQARQCQAGVTLDSGIAERCKTLYALLKPAATAATAGTRILQVSYPVPVAPLNPWRGYSVPSTSPYKSTPLAIPHFSAGGLDFLIENFQQAFIRRMGIIAPNGGGDATYGAAQNAAALDISLYEASKVELELKYFRLSHTRALKESYRFNVWQAQTFLGEVPPALNVVGPEKGHANGRMIPIGKDFANSDAHTGNSTFSQDDTNKTWTVQIPTINLAQVPSFLCISAPRLNEDYIQTGALDRNVSANQHHAAATRRDTSPTDTKAGGDSETLSTARERHYFKEGGFREWRDKQMCVLLSSQQFAPGLMVSDGVAYPINVDVTLELQNRHVDVSALDVQSSTVHKLSADKIRAQAQVTAIFTKIILATTETSATTNAMNYPLDSAERILNSAGSMR